MFALNQHNIDPFRTSSRELTDLLVLFFLAAMENLFVGELQLCCSEQEADLATLAPPPPGSWSSSAPKILTVMVTPLRLTMTGMSSSYTMLGLRSSPRAQGNTSQSSVRELSLDERELSRSILNAHINMYLSPEK